ncbi:N-acetylmuramic acid 6-phosphate etherase (plasmid) [Deinococcus sp. KNUC1210]|uniref:N-acetylmuramic acid 6-phosphate etherase n=1 Tax=Deinococcus sp. KNUC1210 TaxID=2917691 RepID=UPI001EF0D697|nr:N-acetylmuramic acid 6-phosphate etherase [Deinococcus sp. KNUC1210]ULH17621.1 N-acetylmuramic acid 6-phosphate etherase [Deinococcus sp. KNUC1210]
MTTESSHERFRNLDIWPLSNIMDVMLERQFAAVSAVAQVQEQLQQAVTLAAQRLKTAGRLIYVGAGSSGRLAALDALELAPTFGWPRERLAFYVAGAAFDLLSDEEAEDDTAAGTREAQALNLTSADVLVCVSASGSTPYTLAFHRVAAERGALTIALANNPGSALMREADIPVLLDSGAEVIAGSTRLSAGTAQKIALNLFSTLLMVRLGRIYHNQMIEVEPTNAKLRQRSERIVAAASGCDLTTAQHALAEAGTIKLALCLLQHGTLSEASRQLDLAGGHLRTALEASLVPEVEADRRVPSAED